MLTRIKSLGSLLGRDYGKLLERASGLRKAEGPQPAMMMLREGLAEQPGKLDAGQLEAWLLCRLMLGECQAECGLRASDISLARLGVQTLVSMPERNPRTMQAGLVRWQELLTKAEELLASFLAPEWAPAADKRVFLPELAAIAFAWNRLQKPEACRRICKLATEKFGSDPQLLVAEAEADTGEGQKARALAALTAAVRFNGEVQSPGQIISLLEVIQREGDAVQSGAAAALSCEVYCHLSRWDQALDSGRAALQKLTEARLEGPTLVAILVSAGRAQKLDDLELWGPKFLRHGFSEELLARVYKEAQALAGRYPHRARLSSLAGGTALLLGRSAESVAFFRHSLETDARLAPAIVEWLNFPGLAEKADGEMFLGLSQGLFGAGAVEAAAQLLKSIEGAALPAARLEEAVALARQVVEKQPESVVPRGALSRLLLRSGKLEEALVEARTLIPIEGAQETLFALCHEIIGQAQLRGLDALALDGSRLQIDLRLKQKDFGNALGEIESLSKHPAATLEQLLWAAEASRKVAAQPAFEPGGRVLLGDVQARLVSPKEAADQYLAVLRMKPPVKLVERACSGLSRVLNKAGDVEVARHALAVGWLSLGRPAEARRPLLECLEKRDPGSEELLGLTRRQAAAASGTREWMRLVFEAELTYGDEHRLATAVQDIGNMLAQDPGEAAMVEDYARRIEARSTTEDTRRAAVMARLQAVLVRKDFDALAIDLESLARERSAWRDEILVSLELPAASLPEPERARVHLLLGHMFAVSGRPEAVVATVQFQQAAELDPERWADTAVSESVKLASRKDGFPGAILTAVRVAAARGQGAALCHELIRLLDELNPDQLREARNLLQKVDEAQPRQPQVLLVRGRCDHRQQDREAALGHYRALFGLGIPSATDSAVADLLRIHGADPKHAATFLALADALLAKNAVADARSALLARVAQMPAEAEACLPRLDALRKRTGHTWEDSCVLAEACRLAGRAEQAVPIWSEALAMPDPDWLRCAKALQQLCIALPDHFGAGALLLHAEVQALPVAQWSMPVQRLERLVLLPRVDPAFIPGLLADCDQMDTALRNRSELNVRIAFARAALQSLQRCHAAAVEALERIAAETPREAARVAASSERLFESTRDAIYRRSLARARFVLDDAAGATGALRELVNGLPQQLGAAQAMAAEYSAQASSEGWKSIQLLLSELSARSGDLKGAARSFLELAAKSESARLVARDQLLALVHQGAEEPDIHFALADVELAGLAENLDRALSVADRFLARQPEARFADAVAYGRRLKGLFPQRLEPRMHLLGILLRRASEEREAVEEEAYALLADFGQDGARTFRALVETQALRSGPAYLLHLLSEACEVQGDITGSLAAMTALMGEHLAQEAQAIRTRVQRYFEAGKLPETVAVFLGEFELATGDAGRAADWFSRAVELPDAALPKLRDGLERTLQRDGANAVALCALARCAWREGDGLAAARYYESAGRHPSPPALSDRLAELTEAFPELAFCWYVRGQRAYAEGWHGEAFDCLTRALEVSGLSREEQIQAWKLLTECHVREARFEEAISTLRRVMDIAPDDEHAAKRLISLYFDRNAHQLKQARERIERDGESPELIVEYAELLSARGDYAEAVKWFRKVPRDNPLASRAMLALGKCHLAVNDCNLAGVAFRAALNAQPGADELREALYQLGVAHARLLEFDEAVNVFKQLCMEDAGYRDAADQLRRCYEQLHGGEGLRMADLSFDLVGAWRDLSASAGTPVPPPLEQPTDRP